MARAAEVQGSATLPLLWENTSQHVGLFAMLG